jgi:hypothetical protein
VRIEKREKSLMTMARTMGLKQDLIWHPDGGHMTIEIMIEVTVEVAGALKAAAVKGMETSVLATGDRRGPLGEEVTAGGVVIETKNNREYKV